ncbi:MAG: TadE/TadG family type IV pilus assembly protein [Bryobacteraceae bacterium]
MSDLLTIRTPAHAAGAGAAADSRQELETAANLKEALLAVAGGATHPSREKNRPRLRKLRQRGSEMLEFTLAFLPVLGFLFLILNIAWAVYSRATLQYAVAQGVRYAVTSQTMSGMGQRASIQKVVQSHAFGALQATAGAATGVNGWNNIYVDWYLVNADGSLTNEDGVVGGNGMQVNGQLPLVEVSVQSISPNNFVPTVAMPGLSSLNKIAMTATSWDRMEAPPISSGGYVIPPQ